MAARFSPSKLVKRTTCTGVGSDVDVEDEVRALIYGEPAGTVQALGAADSDDGHDPPDPLDPAAAAAAVPSPQPPASDAGPRSEVLDGELAAALLGELDPAAREEVLARAAAQLCGAVARPRQRSSGRVANDVRERTRPARAGRSLEGRARSAPIRVCERSVARDDRVSTISRYRVVIDRGGGGSRSHVEFSTCAPSARGAVAANVRGPDSSVSAVNEVEPADRFSWQPDGSCRCTPANFTNCASGSDLDAEGWCRECGLQVLPPHAGLAASRPKRRSALVARRLPVRLARRVRGIAARALADPLSGSEE